MRRRRAVGLVLAALGIGGAVVSPAMSGAETASLSGVSAIAVAEGVRVTFTIPAYSVVEEVFNGGGAVAQSVVDSFGASSFGSLPHPGDLVLAGPGLFSFVTGVQAPSSYPLYVSASDPLTPHQEFNDPSGSYQLRATAARDHAEGLAQLWGEAGQGQDGGSGGTRSFTSAIRDEDEVTVAAETLNEALTVGQGALRIASVRSRSVTTYGVGQAASTTKTELVVEGGTAAGYSFGYGPDGLTVASQGVPMPASSGLEQLNQGLKVAGISVRIGEGQTVVGGASAQVLEILMRQQSPTPGVPGAILALRFGGATTSVAGLPFPSGDATGPGAMGPADPAVEPTSSPVPWEPKTTPVAVETKTKPLRGGGDTGSSTKVNPMPSAAGALPPVGEVTAPVPGRGGRRAEFPASARTTTPAAQHLFSKEQSADFAYGMMILAGALLLGVGGLWRSKGSLSA